jgi:hypothetical protein
MKPISVPGATGQLVTDVHAKVAASLAALGYNTSSHHAIVTPESASPSSSTTSTSSTPLWRTCVCHVKATDEAGHMGHLLAKAGVLRDVDVAIGHARETLERQWSAWGEDVAKWREIVINSSASESELGRSMPRPPKPVVLVVTGDHTTACTVGDHTAEPVPLIAAVLGTHAPSQALVSPHAFPGDVLVESAFLHGPAGRLTGRDVFPLALELAEGAEQAYDTMCEHVNKQIVTQVLQIRDNAR